MSRETELAAVARDDGERLGAYVATGLTPAMILALEERAELLGELVQALEWIAPGGGFPFCPMCQAMCDVDGDHHAGCPLAAVMALLSR